MRLGLSQNLRIEQRQIQSPQMIQAMQVLQYPLLELQDRIDQELQENIFLDVVEPERQAEEPSKQEDDFGDLEASFQTLEQLDERQRELGRLRTRGSAEDADAKMEALANTPGRHESLAEHLVSQLHLLELDEELKERSEMIAYSLNADGRLVSTLEELAEECECDLDEIEEALLLVQSLDPAGVGARSLDECLMLQLDRIPNSPPLARSIVEKHLENLSMNRLPKIARSTGASIEDVKDAVEFLRLNLHPHPGAPFGEVMNSAISPDIVVEEIDGRFELRVQRGGIPELRISPIYRKLLTESKKDPKVAEYLRRKIDSAKWFIDAIHQRQSTIERIATAIVEKQAEFLRKGVRYLKPLRMQEIADEVGVHISTVSRASSGKYIQTRQGIFDMKRFFGSGTETNSGEVLSQRAVQQKLQEIVDSEDKSKPLSDDAIVAQLEKEGIKIARRTATKYRKALGIPSSGQRREY
ncbi:MAG: RNA polymerase sigma-54 factor [Planctomycetota bacterium]|nr:MAG: RNA polymerase sigma-54 factor [Planctomycetota bacterium]